MADIKNFLYAWCGKKKLTPNYDIRAAGTKNRFMCEVRVDGFNYTGMGNSTNKKDAQSNAARDFVNFLVRMGEMSAAEVPALGVSSDQADVGAKALFGNLPSGGPLPPHLVVKAEQGNNDHEAGSASGIPGGADWERGANLKEYYARQNEQEAQATLESEEVDLNASLHGNWTLENAKARLNQFFQKEKTSADYKYSQVGPDHNRSFIAEMQLFVRQLGRRVTAREHGSNKKLAAQSCALSLVRQLYHLGIFEAYSGVTKKKDGESLEVFDVPVSPDLQQQLSVVVEEFGVQIPPPPANPGESVSLVPAKMAAFEPSQRQTGAGVVPWSPPQVNWNPWTSSNIDEGPLAFCTPEQISMDLQHEMTERLEHDNDLHKVPWPNQQGTCFISDKSLGSALNKNVTESGHSEIISLFEFSDKCTSCSLCKKVVRYHTQKSGPKRHPIREKQ
uniref:RNA helicase n=1 Tax=Hippocampus comes TaxID=109280 RepID=A0A3Q2ZCQ8_HIPCM